VPLKGGIHKKKKKIDARANGKDFRTSVSEKKRDIINLSLYIIWVSACIHTDMYVYVHMNIYKHIHAYINTYIDMHIYIYIYTYTYMCVCV